VHYLVVAVDLLAFFSGICSRPCRGLDWRRMAVTTQGNRSFWVQGLLSSALVKGLGVICLMVGSRVCIHGLLLLML
jgi:hypothetical protein